MASYLAEGEPVGLANGVAKISFPDRLLFHRESLETEVNRKLVEKHLSSLLDEPVKVEFQSVKELSGKNNGSAVKFVDEIMTKDAESAETLKSAMSIFGGKIVKS